MPGRPARGLQWSLRVDAGDGPRGRALADVLVTARLGMVVGALAVAMIQAISSVTVGATLGVCAVLSVIRAELPAMVTAGAAAWLAVAGVAQEPGTHDLASWCLGAFVVHVAVTLRRGPALAVLALNVVGLWVMLGVAWPAAGATLLVDSIWYSAALAASGSILLGGLMEATRVADVLGHRLEVEEARRRWPTCAPVSCSGCAA